MQASIDELLGEIERLRRALAAFTSRRRDRERLARILIANPSGRATLQVVRLA
jgi:hypothetical protein